MFNSDLLQNSDAIISLAVFFISGLIWFFRKYPININNLKTKLTAFAQWQERRVSVIDRPYITLSVSPKAFYLLVMELYKIFCLIVFIFAASLYFLQFCFSHNVKLLFAAGGMVALAFILKANISYMQHNKKEYIFSMLIWLVIALLFVALLKLFSLF